VRNKNLTMKVVRIVAWLVPGVWSIRTVVQVKSNSNMECARQAAQRLPEFTEDTDAPQRIT
jgi:hypothetical protein